MDLLDLWRATRSERVARLIRAVGVADGLPERLAAVTDVVSYDAATRLQTLVDRGPDPRLLDQFERWMVDLPYRTPPGADQFWAVVRDMLRTQAPPTYRPRLVALAARAANAGSGYVQRVASSIHHLQLEPFEARALTDAEEAFLAALEREHPPPAAAAGPDRSALFDAVRRDPDNLAHLLVLHDQLQIDQDPRGLYVTHQLAGETAAAAALLEAHKEAWLGPWLSVVGEVRFVWGFPHTFVLNWNLEHLAKVGGTPELVTLRRIEIHPREFRRNTRFRALPGLLKKGPLPHLRELETVPPDVVQKSLKALKGLRKLGLCIHDDLDAAPAPLAQLPALTHLTLDLEKWNGAGDLLGLLASVRTATVELVAPGSIALSTVLDAVPHDVQTVRWVEWSSTPLDVERTDTGWRASAVPDPDLALHALLALPAGLPWSIHGTPQQVRTTRWAALRFLPNAEDLQVTVSDVGVPTVDDLRDLPPLQRLVLSARKPEAVERVLPMLQPLDLQEVEVKGVGLWTRGPDARLVPNA